MSKSHSKNPKVFKKLAFIVCSIIILGSLAYGGYRYYKYNQPKISPTPTPTIKSLPSTTISNSKNVDTSTSHSSDISGPTDTNNSNVSTAPDTWTRSQSGVITVKTPANNGTFAPGGQLIGSASTPNVQYTLIDNNVGVISQGTIPVVNGNFSASINFTPSAQSGRLDVFTTDSNGKELNEVQLQVAF